MKLDGLIAALTEAKKELGGDIDIRLDVECQGKADMVDIISVSHSKIFGLHMEIGTPWFFYGKD